MVERPRNGVLTLYVAYFEPHTRPDTIAQVEGLDILPHRKIDYRDRTFEEMDTETSFAAQAPDRSGWTSWLTQYSRAPSASSVGKTFKSCWTRD